MNRRSEWFGCLLLASIPVLIPTCGRAQSADWREVIWREPRVRYLLADMTLGGSVKLHRDYATTERDPDSREAIRLWDTGAQVVNTNEFERKKVDGKTLITRKDSNERISGMTVKLSTDLP